MTKKSKIYGFALTVCMLLVSTFVFIACGPNDPDDPVGPSTEYVSIESSAIFQGERQTKFVSVTASGSWIITIKKNDGDMENWLTATPMSGVGSKSIELTAERNATGKVRTAQVIVTGGSGSYPSICEVTQQAATIEEKLNVNPSSLKDFDPAGGAQTFSITSNSSWNVTAPKWCSLSQSSGQGNGNITVTVEENDEGKKRSGEIFIKGKDNSATISVSQNAGSRPTFSEFYNNEAAFTFTYSSDITVTEAGICYSTYPKTTPDKGDSVVTVDSGSKTATVTLSIPSPEKNVTYYVRAYAVNAVGTAYSNTHTYKLSSVKPEEDDNPTPN